MYDILAMPSGFWLLAQRPGRLRWRGSQFHEDRKNNGSLYAYMVWTWRFVFTPAVFLGLLGFLAVLINTQNEPAIIGGVVVILCVLGYYILMRPKLGTD